MGFCSYVREQMLMLPEFSFPFLLLFFVGKLVALSVYVVAVTITIAVPTLSVQFSDDVTMYFIVLAASIILANTTVLCLVFVPKVFSIKFISIVFHEKAHCPCLSLCRGIVNGYS